MFSHWFCLFVLLFSFFFCLLINIIQNNDIYHFPGMGIVLQRASRETTAATTTTMTKTREDEGESGPDKRELSHRIYVEISVDIVRRGGISGAQGKGAFQQWVPP